MFRSSWLEILEVNLFSPKWQRTQKRHTASFRSEWHHLTLLTSTSPGRTFFNQSRCIEPRRLTLVLFPLAQGRTALLSGL